MFRLKVFSCSYNEALLRHHMRQLSFQQSVVLILRCSCNHMIIQPLPQVLIELLHNLLSDSQWSCSNPSYQQVGTIIFILHTHTSSINSTDCGVGVDNHRLTCHAIHHVSRGQTTHFEYTSSHRSKGMYIV